MKIKAALCIGYNGTGYSGLQLNGTLNTIEKAIADTLYDCKAISTLNHNSLKNIHLHSSSRTDKNVHAAFNLVVCKIERNISIEFTNELKDKLRIKNILLYKILRVTKSFLASKMTAGRVYEYVVPTWYLQRSDFLKEVEEYYNRLDRESFIDRQSCIDGSDGSSCIDGSCIDVKECITRESCIDDKECFDRSGGRIDKGSCIDENGGRIERENCIDKSDGYVKKCNAQNEGSPNKEEIDIRNIVDNKEITLDEKNKKIKGNAIEDVTTSNDVFFIKGDYKVQEHIKSNNKEVSKLEHNKEVSSTEHNNLNVTDYNKSNFNNLNVTNYNKSNDININKPNNININKTNNISNKSNITTNIEKIKHYKSKQEDIDRFNSLLQNFIGTKNFHNFTTLSNLKGKSRYIKNITTEKYIRNDIEYIKIKIEGQSFLLHQIRKMTYFCILLTRYKPDFDFSKAFSKDYLHIPKGPGQYLLLDRPYFMKIKDRGAMIDTFDIDENEKFKFKEELYEVIHDEKNLKWFDYSLNSSRFYHDKLEYLK